MNLLSQLASELFINKTTLIQILRTFDFSEEFLAEFRHDRIYIGEDLIRRKIRLLIDVEHEETFFRDLFCHEDGIQFVFYVHLYLSRFIRFRLSFDIKIIALIFNTHHQTIQFMINNIQIKSLNRLLKPFRSCIQVRDFSSSSNEGEKNQTKQKRISIGNERATILKRELSRMAI